MVVDEKNDSNINNMNGEISMSIKYSSNWKNPNCASPLSSQSGGRDEETSRSDVHQKLAGRCSIRTRLRDKLSCRGGCTVAIGGGH